MDVTLNIPDEMLRGIVEAQIAKWVTTLPIPDPLYTVTEAAQYMKIDVTTMRRILRSKTKPIEYELVGKNGYRLRKSVLDSYLARHKRKGNRSSHQTS